MLETRTLPLTDTARAGAAALAALLGILVLYVVAFAQADVLHNAAHDTRHAIVAPCH